MTENKKPDSDISSTVDSTPVTPEKLATDVPILNSPQEKAKTKKLFKPHPPKTTPSTSKSILAASLLLSSTALAMSGWIFYQSSLQNFERDIAQVATQQQNLASKLESQSIGQSQIATLTRNVTAIERNHQAQALELSTIQTAQKQQIQSLDAKLNRLNNTTKEDWKLAEADYLIRLANQRLLLESDSKSATTLLVNADAILNELKDPIVFDARKALAKDIQALQSINEFDLEGAYLKLSALYDNVVELPQREPSKELQTLATETPNSTIPTATIKSTLEGFWTAIQSLVVINYHNKPIKTLLPPAQYQELIASLQLQLDVAQVSLIKGEPTIYQQSLSRVASAVTEHFDTQADSTVSLLANLTAMQQVNPAPELPQPRSSLVAMKSLMTAWIERDDLIPAPPAAPSIPSDVAVDPEPEQQIEIELPADTAPKNNSSTITETLPQPVPPAASEPSSDATDTVEDIEMGDTV
ncbi:uroporphyrinogen-III C-methyltransferase [Marinomonas sp.]|nr:uroporphyrinogen-III C-methyltransferase [Marinomonas sp.]MDB4837808.1 uroporphyrinogen-III C-methyltransferase [Marinomonas sp.]